MLQTTRRSLLVSMAAFGAAVSRTPAFGQTYPDRPVRIVIPFGPGGVGDISIRIVADKLGDKLGRRFIVENMPSPDGIVAGRNVIAAAADGYTLLLLTGGTAASLALYNKFPLDVYRDLTPISAIGYFECLMVVNAQSQFNTLADVLAAAKAKPGGLSVGTVVTGGVQNLTTSYFKQASGLDFVIVPFRTTPDATIALLRNDVQMVIDFYAPLKPGLDGHQFRALAGAARHQVGAATGRRQFRHLVVEFALCQDRHSAPDHRHAQQGDQRSAGRSRGEEASAGARRRLEGQHVGRDGRAAPQRHKEMGRSDREGGDREALSGGARDPLSAVHSGLMLASRMILPQRGMSARMRAAKSSGVAPTGSKPMASILSLTSGDAITLVISR
jgi:tripartite-type tricarboxylate transporter receptor subunit TctC